MMVNFTRQLAWVGWSPDSQRSRGRGCVCKGVCKSDIWKVDQVQKSPLSHVGGRESVRSLLLVGRSSHSCSGEVVLLVLGPFGLPKSDQRHLPSSGLSLPLALARCTPASSHPHMQGLRLPLCFCCLADGVQEACLWSCDATATLYRLLEYSFHSSPYRTRTSRATLEIINVHKMHYFYI